MKLIPIINTVPAETEWTGLTPVVGDEYTFEYNSVEVSVEVTGVDYQADLNTGLAAVGLDSGVVTAVYAGGTLTLTAASTTATLYGGTFTEDPIFSPTETEASDTPATQITPTSTNVTGASKWYMFDGYTTTQTVNADSIEVEFPFDNMDRVAVLNVDAYSIDLELTDDDTSTVVQTKTIDLEMSDGYYQQWVVEVLYIYANATLKVTINKSGGTAACGKVAIGLSTEVGTTLDSPTIGFTDYSIKDTDSFGRTYLNQGNWAKKPTVRTRMPIEIMDAVYSDLVNIRGELAVFECNENGTDYECLRVYGFLEDWRINLNSDYTGAYLEMNIQGVI